MRIKILLVLILFSFASVLSTSPAAADDPSIPEVNDSKPVRTFDIQGSTSDGGRVMVVTDGDVTDSMLEELEKHGKVHWVIDRYDMVVMTTKGKQGREAVEALSFVISVTNDQRVYLTGEVGAVYTWWNDIIDVGNVGDTGINDEREVDETGDGVTIFVIDTGLPKEWRDFLPESRVGTDLARAIMGGGASDENDNPGDPPRNPASPANKMWERDRDNHGLEVASFITGRKGVSGGEEFIWEGVAPGATVVPLKVFPNGKDFAAWESAIIGGIAYVTQLKEDGDIGPAVINLSLGGPEPVQTTRTAIQDAISQGVIVVASAGNEGEAGMSYPAAFREVISVGASGWTEQFVGGSAWWAINDVGNDLDDTGTSEEEQSYVVPDSSRAIDNLGQELDILAPGIHMVGPDPKSQTGVAFFSGTSFSAPLVAGVAALILEKNPTLNQTQVEGILKGSALLMGKNDSRSDILPFFADPPPSMVTIGWDDDCDGLKCDPVGTGLLQADKALANTPDP